MARLHNNSEFPKGWDGHVRLYPERLKQLSHWRKPRRIAVGLMGDLFHDAVTDEFIDKVFAVMALCPQHTFQVLTKRPARMLEYCNSIGRHHEIDRVSMTAKQINSETGFFYILGARGWYLSNVWLGVSCENQAAADERIPLLLQTPAAVRFVSCEPLLGSIDLRHIHYDGTVEIDALTGDHGVIRPLAGRSDAKLDWIIAGGESGPGAWPMHPEWPRYLKDQCQAAGIPYHFKQWGEWAHLDWRHEMPAKGDKWVWCDRTSHAIDGYEMPSTMQGCALMRRGGKKAAGRLLDGREWLEFPNA
jgi:protein gp37